MKMRVCVQIVFSVVGFQIISLSEINCVSVNGKEENSQQSSGSRDFGYGPFHVNENSGSAGATGSSSATTSNQNANGMSPFSANGASASSTGRIGAGSSGMSSPFTANFGQGMSSGGSGMKSPFPASGGSSSTGSMGAGPFSMNDNGGSGAQGSNGLSSPFSVGGPGKGGGTGTGSGPFAASANLGGIDMSSLSGFSGGPGGLSGGNFDASMLMGHDFSKDLVGSSQGGVYTGVKAQYSSDGSGSKSQNQYGIDTAKFDTSAYQQMLDQLFNPKTYDKELLASPFHGDNYELPQGQGGKSQGQGYETSHESSVGSYASTDMSHTAYSAHSGSYQGSWNSGGQGYNSGHTGGDSSGVGQGHSSNGGGLAQNPFDTSRFMTGTSSSHLSNGYTGSSTSAGTSGMHVNSPFKITSAEKGETPFKVGNAGQGETPFKITDASQGASPFKIIDSNQGVNPFDIGNHGNGQGQSFQSLSGGQLYESGTGTFGENKFLGSSGTDHKNGLDQYGNVDFSKLSGLTGSGVDMGTGGTSFGSSSGTGNYPSYSGGTSFGSSSGTGNYPSYSGGTSFGSSSGTGNYPSYSGGSYTSYAGSQQSSSGVNTGVSEGQFKTPFESDNYNDLLGNPFDSSSNFNSNHENFNQPAQSGGLQSYQGSAGSAGSAGLQSYQGSGSAGTQAYSGSSGSYGQGPAGNPFNQGGARMGLNRG